MTTIIKMTDDKFNVKYDGTKFCYLKVSLHVQIHYTRKLTLNG